MNDPAEEMPTRMTVSDQTPASLDLAHGIGIVPAAQPAQIGRFAVKKVLGQGGFGLVYLAHDEQLNRCVAVKVPHAKLISKPENAEAYLAEARTAADTFASITIRREGDCNRV